MFQLGFIGGADPVLPEPSGSPLGDALSAVAAAAHAAITGHGLTRADLWPLLGRYGLARHLAPARARLTTAGRPGRPGHRHARGLAATLTMTTTTPPAPLAATP